MRTITPRGSRDGHRALVALVAIVAGAIATIGAARPAAARPIPPRGPNSWVVDEARLLTDAEELELDRLSRRVWAEEGVRLAVLTLGSLDGDEPKSAAVRALNQWEAGPRSALVLVSKSPRKLYLQPGTDLAATFDEPTASAICRDVIAPKLRGGAPGTALGLGLEAVRARVVAAGPSLPVEPTGSVALSSGTEHGLPRHEPVTTRDVVAVADGVGTTMGIVAMFFAPFGIVALIVWGIWRLSRRPCPRCGKQMSRARTTLDSPTEYSTGSQRVDDDCRACGFHKDFLVTLPMIVTSTSDSSSYSSSDSSSSWSSSDSSSSSSDSGSSSSGAGGGGSDW